MYAASSSKQNKKQQHICNICSRIFESEEALGAHKRIEHGESTHAPAGVGWHYNFFRDKQNILIVLSSHLLSHV